MLRLTAAILFFRCRLLTAYQPTHGGQSTLQPWAGGAVVSAPILVSGGQRFESSPVHFFSLLSPTTPHTPIPSFESHHIPSVVFTRVCHPRSRSTDFCCSPFSSFGFRRLRRRHSSSANQTILSNQSSLPLIPFPAIGGPGDSNNTSYLARAGAKKNIVRWRRRE